MVSLLQNQCVTNVVCCPAGTSFQRVILDSGTHADPQRVRRVVFCSGKIYYELAKVKCTHHQLHCGRLGRLCRGRGRRGGEGRGGEGGEGEGKEGRGRGRRGGGGEGGEGEVVQ